MKRFVMISLATAMLASSYAYAESFLPSVMSGGVGQEEEETMQTVQHNYSTKLVFTGENGMYLADIAVSIRDRKGQEVVNGVSSGPILLAELVPGRYIVQAETEGYSRTQTIDVGTKTKTYYMQFPVMDNQNAHGIGLLEDNDSHTSMHFPG